MNTHPIREYKRCQLSRVVRAVIRIALIVVSVTVTATPTAGSVTVSTTRNVVQMPVVTTASTPAAVGGSCVKPSCGPTRSAKRVHHGLLSPTPWTIGRPYVEVVTDGLGQISNHFAGHVIRGNPWSRAAAGRPGGTGLKMDAKSLIGAAVAF